MKRLSGYICHPFFPIGLAYTAPGGAAHHRPGSTGLPQGALSLLLAFAISVALLPVVSRLLIFTPSTGAVPQLGAWLLFAFTLSRVIGPLIVIKVEDRFGWNPVCLGAIGACILSGDMLAWMTRLPALLALGLAVGHGVALGLAGALQWEKASRLVRDHARQTGQRTDGLMFGSVIFTIQLSVACGALILGRLLDDFTSGGLASALAASGIVSLSGVGVALLLVTRRRDGRERPEALLALGASLRH